MPNWDPDEPEDPEYGGEGNEFLHLVADAGIDGPEYTDRDRHMFVLGMEFALLYSNMTGYPDGIHQVPQSFDISVHKDNKERAMRLLILNKRKFKLTDLSDEWTLFEVEADP